MTTEFPMALAPHFPELESAWRLIPDSHRANAVAMLQLAERVRAAGGGVPVRVNSWYRSPTRNVLAGGAKNSQHLTASAMDFSASGIEPQEWFARVRNALPGHLFGQMIYYQATSRHLHVSLPNRSSGIVGEILIENRPGRYTNTNGVAVSDASREGLADVTGPLLGIVALLFLIILVTGAK